MNRLNEISFNASLMSEMRAIDFVQRLLDAGRLEQPRYRRIFLHCIEDEDRMREFKLSTKLNGDWEFLLGLRRYGREAADRFLAEHFDSIGRESTLGHQALPVAAGEVGGAFRAIRSGTRSSTCASATSGCGRRSTSSRASRIRGRRRVVDLGCGAGSAMPALRARFPDAALRGVDGSAAMLAKARAAGFDTEQADIAQWSPAEPVDVLFSNAALHWLPDHATLFPRLLGTPRAGRRRAGGADAAHARGAGARGAGPAGCGGPLGRIASAPCGARRRCPTPLGTTTCWRPGRRRSTSGATEYLHVLRGEDPVARWAMGSSLRPYIDALEGEPELRRASSPPMRRRCAAPTRRKPTARCCSRSGGCSSSRGCSRAAPQQHQPRRRARPHHHDRVLPEPPGEHRRPARVGGEEQVALRPAAPAPLPFGGRQPPRRLPQPRHHARVPTGAACGRLHGFQAVTKAPSRAPRRRSSASTAGLRRPMRATAPRRLVLGAAIGREQSAHASWNSMAFR